MFGIDCCFVVVALFLILLGNLFSALCGGGSSGTSSQSFDRDND